MPVVTPTWAYPAVFFLAGILLWPPVLAVLVGRVRWRVAHGVAAGVLMLALVVTGLLAWMAPAFTTERPQQRSALFVEDRVRGDAHWELYGNEPGVDIGAGRPGQRRLAGRRPIVGARQPKSIPRRTCSAATCRHRRRRRRPRSPRRWSGGRATPTSRSP